jgi:hypothetical protein
VNQAGHTVGLAGGSEGTGSRVGGLRMVTGGMARVGAAGGDLPLASRVAGLSRPPRGSLNLGPHPYQVLHQGVFPQDPPRYLRERCTDGNRCEPLGSDGMWTKRGPEPRHSGGPAGLDLVDFGDP